MGGIGLVLLAIIVLVAIILGAAFYALSGVLWAGKTSPKGDRIEGSDAPDAPSERPQHVRVDTDSPTAYVGKEE